MTAMHRVKAYFGMVPADELDSYDGWSEHDDRRRDLDRYDDPRFDEGRYEGSRYESRYEGSRYDDRGARRPRSESDRHDRYDESRYERLDADRHALDRLDRLDRGGRPERDAHDDRREDRLRTPRPRDPEPARLGTDHDRDEETDVSVRSSARGRAWEHNTGPNHTSRGTRSGSLSSVGGGSSAAGLSAQGAAALALDDEPRREPAPEPAPEPPAKPEIVTLQPTSYNEARVIGERYRDGIPVIMNLTEMDDVAAKRLVDFAAGLAFALRGSIEKVTNRVFLLSPPNVEVSPTDRRKLAESSYSASS